MSMRRHVLTATRPMGFGALLLAAVLASLSFAQTQSTPNAASPETGRPYLISIVHVQLAAGREWEDLIRNEYVPALKKAGVTQFNVWKTATLGKDGQYLVGRPIKDPAELDDPDPILRALGQDGNRALFAKLDRITASVQTLLITQRPDLSIAPASGYVPKLAGLTETSVAPGRTAEYEKAQMELLAVVRKTNIKGVLASRVSGGGDPNQYNALMLFDSYADMAQWGLALNKAVAEAKLGPRPAGVVQHAERTMLRYVPELSMRPSAQKASK